MLILSKQLLKLRAISITILSAVFSASEDVVVSAMGLFPLASRDMTGKLEGELWPWRMKRALCKKLVPSHDL